MKNKDYLTVRQEELMNFLWKVNEPLTANEMAERLAEDGWNNVTLFKTVQSLTTDGYLEVVGLEKTVKTYARKLAPSMSKDDYYASVLIKRGIDSSSIANITAALIGAKDKQAKEKNAEVIAKLEEIIDTLKNDDRNDNQGRCHEAIQYTAERETARHENDHIQHTI